MKKTWLLNFENKYRINKATKRKKIKVKPKKSREEEESHDDIEEHSCGSTTSTVVSMVADKEFKRGKKLLYFLKKCDIMQCGAGSPSCHISRQLNRPNPISVNIDKSSAKNLYNFSTRGPVLSFSQKPPPEGTDWDHRIYPSVPLFEDMTPRDGMSRRKKGAAHSPSHRDFTIRDSVADSLPPPGREGVVLEGSEESLSGNVLDTLLEELHTIGGSISHSDLASLALIRTPPPPFVDALFTYLHVLVMGSTPEEDDSSLRQRRPPHERQSPGQSTALDARRILLREPGCILQYLQHVRIACCLARMC